MQRLGGSKESLVCTGHHRNLPVRYNMRVKVQGARDEIKSSKTTWGPEGLGKEGELLNNWGLSRKQYDPMYVWNLHPGRREWIGEMESDVKELLGVFAIGQEN